MDYQPRRDGSLPEARALQRPTSRYWDLIVLWKEPIMMDERKNSSGGSVAGITEGMVIDGKVRKIVDFGIFVEVAPKKDGLVHISTIARDKQATLLKKIKPGDPLKVKVIAVEPETGRIRLMAPDLK